MSTPAFPHAALPAHARGIDPDEAGTELLISHGSFPVRSDFRDRFPHPATSITDGTTTMASLDWPRRDQRRHHRTPPCSDGERQILQTAANLTHGIHLNRPGALTGLDASGQRPRFLDHS